MKTTILKSAYTLALGTFLAVPVVQAQSGASSPMPHRIHFTRGATSQIVKVILSDQQPRPFYVVKTRAGQKMSVRVDAGARSQITPVVNVFSPSGQASELIDPKTSRFDTQNTEAGEYRIRVGLNLMATDEASGICHLKVWIK